MYFLPSSSAASRASSSEVHQVSAVDMFKALIENKYLLGLFITHTVQYIGQFIFQGLTAYYWMYVVGDFSKMTLSNLIAAGVDPKTVQYLAGHESSKITMDIYAKVKYNRPEEVAKALDGAFTLWNEQCGS